MCRDRFHQTGFSLPLAIFILVVVSLLALAIFRMNALNQNSVVQEVLSARAFLAAESGAQTQMMRVFPVSGAGVCAAQSLTFNAAGLNACTSNSSCNSIAANGQTYYEIESVGRCGVGNVTAQRTLQLQAHDL